MCPHRQMWQCSKQSPVHHLLTCIMPYVGIITSNLMKRKRPGKTISVVICRTILSKLYVGIFTWQSWTQATLALLGCWELHFFLTLEGWETEVLRLFTEQVEHGQQQFNFAPHYPATVPRPWLWGPPLGWEGGSFIQFLAILLKLPTRVEVWGSGLQFTKNGIEHT